MPKIPPLKALQAFEAAARLESFHKAADELFVTPSAISHQIKLLEEYLGITLFLRQHRKVELSDIGKKYALNISRAINIIEKSTTELKETPNTEILTIQSVPSIAAQWLRHRIPKFSQENNIDVRLNASMDTVDLISGQADIAICYHNSPLLTAPANKGLVIKPFPKEKYIVVCAPSLLTEPFNIQNQILIHSELNLYKWQQWSLDNKNILTEDQLVRGPRFDRTFISINAIVDGDGVGLESTLMLEKELEKNKIAFPLGTTGPSFTCHYLAYSQSKKHTRKINIFKEWIMEELNKSCYNFP